MRARGGKLYSTLVVQFVYKIQIKLLDKQYR